jgi:hypothetical protein
MASSEQAYVPTLPRVKQALNAVVNIEAHRSFAGYLCVLNAASITQRLDGLRPDFRSFFDRFFRIGNPPDKKPYVVPFTRGAKSLLFNENVAGSYAPSSIRPVNPLHNLMKIEGGGAQAVFTLHTNHLQIARDLLLSKPLPAYEFACFMYRDVGFSVNPDRSEIEGALRTDFGFAMQGDLYADDLFVDDLGSISAADFEVMEAA